MPPSPFPESPGPSPSAPSSHLRWSAGNRRSARAIATADSDRAACRSWSLSIVVLMLVIYSTNTKELNRDWRNSSRCENCTKTICLSVDEVVDLSSGRGTAKPRPEESSLTRFGKLNSRNRQYTCQLGGGGGFRTAYHRAEVTARYTKEFYFCTRITS